MPDGQFATKEGADNIIDGYKECPKGYFLSGGNITYCVNIQCYADQYAFKSITQ